MRNFRLFSYTFSLFRSKKRVRTFWNYFISNVPPKVHKYTIYTKNKRKIERATRENATKEILEFIFTYNPTISETSDDKQKRSSEQNVPF